MCKRGMVLTLNALKAIHCDKSDANIPAGVATAKKQHVFSYVYQTSGQACLKFPCTRHQVRACWLCIHLLRINYMGRC